MDNASDQPRDEEKKIIVDEDWKSQVEAERESAREQRQAAESPQQAAGGPAGPPPQASLSVLVSGLYLQGMVALGLLPDPTTNKPEVQPNYARYTIDMLQLLQEKTEGNRTAEESKELEQILHELRMAYVSVQDAQKNVQDAQKSE
jgi:hypothetical protein